MADIMKELKFVLTFKPIKGYYKDTPIDFDELEFSFSNTFGSVQLSNDSLSFTE